MDSCQVLVACLLKTDDGEGVDDSCRLHVQGS